MMSLNVVTFGSIKSLIIFSITFYLCVMFYIHTRLSNEDLRISRLERLARDRMPSPKKGMNLPSDVFIDSDGVIKAKRSAVNIKSGEYSRKTERFKKDKTLQNRRVRKGQQTAAVKHRNKNRNRNSHRDGNNAGEFHAGQERYRSRYVPRSQRLNDITTLKRELNVIKLNKFSVVLPDHRRLITASRGNGRLFDILPKKSVNTTSVKGTPVKVRILDALHVKDITGKKAIVEKGHQRIKVNSNTKNTQHAGQLISLRRNARKDMSFLEVLSNIFVYAAYLDERVGRYLRFVSVAFREEELLTDQFICHFHGGRSSSGKFYRTCEDHMLLYAAYVISCPVPESESMVTIIKKGVIISNSSRLTAGYIRMKITPYHSNKQKKQFNVCVPPLFGNVSAYQIIEFIEVNKILGANHFTFYRENSSASNRYLTKVLNMYSRAGDATVIPWQLPVKHEDLWYHGQSVSVWDCLFRNMNNFNYIAFKDIDEIIVPNIAKTWRMMIDGLLKSRKDGDRIAAFSFASADFDNSGGDALPNFSDAIKDLSTLNTIWRDKSTDYARSKLMVDPSKVFELGIHHLSKPINDKYITLNVDPKSALLHHYRKCEERRWKCKQFVQDVSLWRFYPDIVNNVKRFKERLKNLKGTVTNSLVPDQAAKDAVADQGLLCLLKIC